MRVVEFIRVRWVPSDAPWGSSRSFGFIWAHPGGRTVHSVAPRVLLGSFWRAMGGGWIHSGTGFVGFIQVRPEVRTVDSAHYG